MVKTEILEYDNLFVSFLLNVDPLSCNITKFGANKEWTENPCLFDITKFGVYWHRDFNVKTFGVNGEWP